MVRGAGHTGREFFDQAEGGQPSCVSAPTDALLRLLYGKRMSRLLLAESSKRQMNVRRDSSAYTAKRNIGDHSDKHLYCVAGTTSSACAAFHQPIKTCAQGIIDLRNSILSLMVAV